MYGFRTKLAERQVKTGSLVCVGLDPLPEKMPKSIKKRFWLRQEWKVVAQWMIDVVDATAPHACMFKPQRAHYEAFRDGRKILTTIIDYIHEFHPDIPVFLDCKRGDIGRTQQRYRIAHFDIDGAEGVNFSPYMGKDCMEHLADEDHSGRAIVGLCYTSNPAARQVQDVKLESGEYYWEFMARNILNWAEELGITNDAGLVMAAAHEKPKGSGEIYSYHLSRVREIVGDKLWFLIPGVGTQDGFVEETVKTAYQGPGSIAINSSSGIIFASAESDYAEAAAEKAEELRDRIISAGGNIN